MADKEYGLKFTTTADVKGAQQAEASIKSVEQAVKNLDRSTGKGAAETAKYFDELRKNRNVTQDQAQYLSDLTKEAKNNAETVEKQTVPAWRRLGEGFKRLGNEIPALGAAINALKNPWAALAFVIAGAVIKVREMIEVQKELARQGAAAATALDPLVLRTVRLQLAAEKVKTALQEHSDRLADIAEKANSAEVALGRFNKQVDRETNEADSKDELETAKAIAANPENEKELRAGLEARKAQRAQRATERKATQLAEADRKAKQAARLAGYQIPAAEAEVQDLETAIEDRTKKRAALMPDIDALKAELERLTLRGRGSYQDPLVRQAMVRLGIGPTPTEQDIRNQLAGAQSQADGFAAANERDQRALDQAKRRAQKLRNTVAEGDQFTEAKTEAVADAMSSRIVTANTSEAKRITAAAEKAEKEMKEAVKAIEKTINRNAEAWEEIRRIHEGSARRER